MSLTPYECNVNLFVVLVLSKRRILNMWKNIFRVVLVNIFVLGFINNTLGGEMTLACKLAVINYKNNSIRNDDPRAKIFESYLDSLESKCKNSRKDIGDILVKSVQILKNNYGIEASLLDFTKRLDEGIPRDSNSLNLDLAEVAAIYITLYTESSQH